VDQGALKAAVSCDGGTWTDKAGTNESLPMTCLDWYTAFSFCAWDGGRLPTEAEWNYAAAGGDEQRRYPWSKPPSSTTIDATLAVYDCKGDGEPACSPEDILRVGSKSPVGDAKWEHADLAGSVWEWALDGYEKPYKNPCTNCAITQASSSRVLRGGSWGFNAAVLLSSGRFDRDPKDRFYDIGARCARKP
jgi:formylglycine-generating enzyme required for sulfatase activity